MKWLTMIIAQLIEAENVEVATDKKGRPFNRAIIQDGIEVGRPYLTVKSVVWYVADGHIRILANVGGRNRRTGKWSRSITVTLKEVNPDFILVLDGKKREITARRGWGRYNHIVYGDKRSFIPIYDPESSERPF